MYKENLIKTGRSFYAIGIICLAAQQFIYSDFRPVFLPEWPLWMHASAVWAYLFGAILAIAGIFILIGWKSRESSLLLGCLFFIFFLV